MSLLIRLFGLLITLLAFSWGTAALWFDGPGPEAPRLGLVLSFATACSWAIYRAPSLAISIETRKEVGEDYSAVRGFFRQFELAYVLADEQDVIALRTNHRGEVVYRCPLPAGKAEARRLLEDYAVEVNRLAEQPDWYNALTHNCTTSIRHHIQAIDAGGAWDYRFLANGLLDEMMYERGVIDTTLPFAEVRAAHDITARAKAAGDDPSFSALIRLTAH